MDRPNKLPLKRILKTIGIVLMAMGIFALLEYMAFKTKAISIVEQIGIAVEESLLNASFELDCSPLKNVPNQGGSYMLLSRDGCAVYEKLYKAIWMHADSIRINGFSDDEVFDIVCQMKFDHPELIHLGSYPNAHSETIHTDMDHTVVTLYPEYVFDEETTNRMREELSSKVEEISRMIPSGYGERDIAKYAHNILCSLTEYRDDEASDQYEGHSAYDSLCNASAVCEGYSLGYTLLCRSVGMKCETIVGTLTRSRDPNVGHAWNRIYVDGEWLYVDTTFDDGMPISDEYLLRSQSFMESEGYIPYANNILPSIIG